MKRFDFEAFDRKLDAELLVQDAQNEQQKQWAEHDAANDIGATAMQDVTTDLV